MRFTMKKDGISADELFKTLPELLKSYVLCLLLFLVAGAGWPMAVAQSSNTLLQIIEQSRASDAIWSIQVRDLEGNLLEDLNGNYIMRPASLCSSHSDPPEDSLPDPLPGCSRSHRMRGSVQ